VAGPQRPPREPPIDRRPELLPDDRRRARRGAIELVAATIAIAALVALAVWFVFFARHPLLH
jgi:Flp pilus assembly protein TadB